MMPGLKKSPDTQTPLLKRLAAPGSKGRLLLLSTNMGIGGGAEDQVMHLALELDRRGWQTHILSMLPPSDLLPQIIERGIVVENLGMRKGLPDPRAVFRVVKKLREFQPDILHTHMTHANLLGRVARMFTPVPVLISTLHGFKMYGINQRFTAFRELGHRLTDPWADLTTAICEAATGYYRDANCAAPAKLLALPNGLDTQHFRPDPAVRERIRRDLGLSGFIWVAVGRLESPKNYPLLLRSFAGLPDGTSTLIVCGGGALHEQLLAQIEDLKLAGRVRLLGIRRDVPAILNGSDAFVMSSDTEGLPMALLQAASTGLPIVTTQVGGTGEVVEPGKTGFLVDAGDEAGLRAAMLRVQAMPEAERAAMGAAARQFTIDHFELENVAERWEELYFRLLQKNKKK